MATATALLGIPVAPSGDWLQRGACSAPGAPATAVFFSPRKADEDLALSVCAHCLVRTDCRAYALSTPRIHGVWGGTTDRDRVSLAARGRRRRSGQMELPLAASMGG